MTVACEDGAENNSSAEPGAQDADTQEYSEVDLAACVQQKNPHDNNGDLKTPWARLVSVDKNFPNIELANHEVYVGRADVISASGKEDLHISKAHCKIWRSNETGACYVQNLSVNGTTVQGKPIEKDQQVILHQGDEVALGPHTSGCPVFVFQIINKVHLGHQKRGLEIQTDTATIDAAENADKTTSSAKRPKMMESIETFKCSICLNVWHDVVSLTPCLHSFCNSCFSDWYRRSRKNGVECNCPQCRGTVTSARRNHTLRSLVEDLLKEDPSLCPSPNHILEMEKKSLFKAGGEAQFEFGKDRTSWVDDDTKESTVLSSDDEEGDEEDEEEEYGGCFQCSLHGEIDATGGFQCAEDQSHLTCHGCSGAFPERDDLENVAQKCQVCSRAYCRSYWESQNLTHVVLNLPGSCSEILPIAAREFIEMPRRTYMGNAYEQEVTRQYMAEQGLTLQAVIREWLPRLDTGQAGQPRTAVATQHRVTSCSAVCDNCAEDVVAHLLYEFRKFVPKTELPPDAAGRPDCWYGHECRTQHHKESHVRKLNHVCEPTTRKPVAR